MLSLQTADYLLLALAAFASSLVSGLGGFGGAFILVIVLTPIVGAKSVVPLISIFAVFNNFSRFYIYRETIRWRLAMQFYARFAPRCVRRSQLLSRDSGACLPYIPGKYFVVGHSGTPVS